jgi:hypothetical protein
MQLSSPVWVRGQRVQGELIRLIKLLVQVIATVAVHGLSVPK